MISLKAVWDAFQKHTHTLTSLGAAAANHTHTLQSLGAAAANHTHPNMNKTVTDVLFAGEILPSDRAWTNICAVDVDRYFAISITGDSGEPDLSSNTGTWYVSTLLVHHVAMSTGYNKEIHYFRIVNGMLQALCPNQDHWDNSINRVFGIRSA